MEPIEPVEPVEPVAEPVAGPVFAEEMSREEPPAPVAPLIEPVPVKEVVETNVQVKSVAPRPIIIEEDSDYVPAPDFAALVDILRSDAWPCAISQDLICDETSDEECEERAEGVLDLLIEQCLSGLSFLDFGCGQGHVAKKATQKGVRQAVGYDIVSSGNLPWNEWQDNYLLSTDFEMVKQHAPYDVILLYDVLDHIKDEDPGELLRQLANMKSPGGKMYVR